MGSTDHQKGSIQWFLSQAAAVAEQRDPNSRRYKQPRLQASQQQTCKPHLGLRSVSHCQQLFAQQLGWRCPPSLNSWHQAQQHPLSCICLKTHQTPTGFRTNAKPCPISCLQVQQLPNSSSGCVLVALGNALEGKLHICRLSRLQAASASALNAATALPADVREALLDPNRWARQVVAAEGVPTGAGNIPAAAATRCAGDAAVLTYDTQQQLRSCCWLQQQPNGSAAASSSEGVLVTSGPGGLVKRIIAEGRQSTSSLRAKGGSMVEAAGMVASLDGQAAYQLCAVSGKSLLLWDLRSGPAAAATLPVQAPPQLLRAMPGGQVLLSAEANGRVCLYDVRRLNSSSIVNFGSSRGSQQLLQMHNLKARAHAAGFSSGGCSISYGVTFDGPQFLSDAVLNPVDPNLLAYIKPDLQAGLFDLFSGQVLDQVPVVEIVTPPGTSSTAQQAAKNSLTFSIGHYCTAEGCQGSWDSSGRVLYTQGLLQFCPSDAGDSMVEASATLAAIDFGSWHGRKQRWLGSNGSSQAAAGALEAVAGGEEQAQGERAGDDGAGASTGAESQGSGSDKQQRWQGRGLLAHGGQVLHRELHRTAAPTAFAAAGTCGEMLVGTRSGDVLCLG